MRAINLIFLGFTLLCSLSGKAQQAELDTIQNRFKDQREKILQEKIYVHVDRPQYITGETMWFKIYYVDGTRHRALDLSKVCYLEIIDDIGTSVAQTKVKITRGGGNGSLFIPATMNTGNYTVRAYTNWMKNTSPEYFFHTNITIINPFRTPDPTTASAAKQPDAQFFPEGGNMIAELQNKVAFRVINESGAGIDFNGAVISSLNDTIIRFNPLRSGIGSFVFTPQANQAYRAVIKLRNGKSYSYNLPEVKSKGYTLQVSNGDEAEVAIRSTTQEPYVFLFVHTRQMIQKAEVIFLRNGEGSLKLNKKTLPDGITHITLFDSQTAPVAERLIYKRSAGKRTVGVNADQTAYDLRQKGNLELDGTNLQAKTDLSVAIYRIDSLPPVVQEDITSYFLLTSDLNGTVENPEYYLTSTDSLVAQATDNLMLTHGWRRFTWEKVLKAKPVVSFMPEVRGHVIQAEVRDADSKPSVGIASYLSTPGKIVRIYGSRSDQSGNVFFETIDFFGPNKIHIQNDLRRDSTHSIRVISPFSNTFATRKIPSLNLTAAFEDPVLERSVAMQVQDVYPNVNFNTISNALRDSTAFFGTADETYYLDDYTRFPVMEEVMREYVRGVLVRKRRDGFHFLLPDKLNDGVLRDDPVILLDGFPIWVADIIMKFDPLKVRKLEVVNRIYYLGSMFFPGVVSYITYQGDLGGLEPDRRVVINDYEGLQFGREYYSPIYDDKTSRQSRLPDQRSLIYWNPDVKLGGNQKASLPFYTSDMKGRFVVVVKGLSEDGQPVSAATSFDVRRFEY